jgi:DNA-binding MarR family transcriptional regulator
MTTYENLRLQNQLCFALYAATNAITRAYRIGLSKVGLTYSQYLVMMVLWESDGVAVKNIAKRLQLDPPTITSLLKRLEFAGFINRQRNVSDERVVNIYLTGTGRDIQASVAKIQQGIVCQTALSESEFIELRSSLYQLVDKLHANQPELQRVA